MSGGRPTGLRRWLLVKKIDALGAVLRRLLRSRRFLSLVRRGRVRMKRPARWIARHDDLVEVLQKPADFGMPYMTRMEQLGTPFILGLDPSDAYADQREALDDAFEQVDFDALAALTREVAERQVEAALGEIDVLEQLTDVVLAETAGEALWGEAITAGQIDQARAVARDIFVNPLGHPDVRDRAEVAAPKLLRHARELVEARAAGGDGKVVDRLLASGMREDDAVENLLGLMVAWLTSVSRAMGCAFDVLLRPEHAQALGWAQAAAGHGDTDTVEAILLEALRLQPAMPALERVCLRDARVGRRRYRRGDQVLLVMTSAMLDPHRVAAPLEFRPGRPHDEYLHFGRGAHRCVGRRVARMQMGEIGVALLRRPNLRRRSDLEMEGPYPKHLRVAYDEL